MCLMVRENGIVIRLWSCEGDGWHYKFVFSGNRQINIGGVNLLIILYIKISLEYFRLEESRGQPRSAKILTLVV